MLVLQESSQYVEADSNLYRNVGTCKGVNNGAITPYEIVTGYDGNDNTTDQLRVFRTDLFLGPPADVRNNLLLNGINISYIDTLGLLKRWKQRFEDVRNHTTNCIILTYCFSML